MGALEALEPEDPRQVGRYKVVARLGSGGMGQVYLAHSPGGRPVAVKVVRPDLAGDGDFRRRFAREVSAARRVNGAFTAGVVDADPDGCPAWLATVYVAGVPLGEAISGHGPWPAHSVRALGAGLAEALEAIHAAGVVHRDLKPSNVLLAADGPKVIDFGISVTGEASALTSTGMTIGTPGFMSPEQLTGRPVGPASDVFALGTVLAYAATGVGPFGTGTPHALHFRAVYEQPNLDPLPPDLRPVIAACLAKQPDQRPTVAALLERLTTPGGEEEGGATAADTLLLTNPGWMPDQVAQLVQERHNRTPLPRTPPSALPETPPERARLAPPTAPAPTSEADETQQPTEATLPTGNRAPADRLGAAEPPSPRRRLPLAAALGVAVTAVAIPVIISLWGGADSDGKDEGAARIEQPSSSHTSSPRVKETRKVKPSHIVKLPESCKALSRPTIDQLVPKADNRNGVPIESTDTSSPVTCTWNGLADDLQYRWLALTLSRSGTGSAGDSGESEAKDVYAAAIARAQATDGARNVRTQPVSGLGDQAMAVSYDVTKDGDVFKEATIVVRMGNAVIDLHYSGAGFSGGATPDSATITKQATAAAKEAVESVAKANA
ncbi:serine/threonine-protein kinase [Streptomyces syringium]|uniref:serine/threonine-protein kinase n=1 Tax=Streptomyces syringium TaxID=76729 RepID=UPI0033DBBBFA